MPADDQAITPGMLMEHMRRMESVLVEKMDRIERKVDTNHAELTRKFDTLTTGVDSIDRRLDAIEIEKLPARLKAMEMQR